MFQHVVYTLPGKELVGVTGLTKAIKEEWEIVVIVQLFYLHLGRDEREGRRVGRRKEGREHKTMLLQAVPRLEPLTC